MLCLPSSNTLHVQQIILIMDINYGGPVPKRLCLALCMVEFKKYILIIVLGNKDKVVKTSASINLMRNRQ